MSPFLRDGDKVTVTTERGVKVRGTGVICALLDPAREIYMVWLPGQGVNRIQSIRLEVAHA